MKILEHGKVERRQFTCPKCGCVFLAYPRDFMIWDDNEDDVYFECVTCPEEGCTVELRWHNGKPYEEPEKLTDREKLSKLMHEQPMRGCIQPHYISKLAGLLAENGVTFKETEGE